MEKEKSPLPSTNLGAVIDVLEDMRTVGIVSDYAIGGAVAAVLHNEPISTVDLDIFFLFTEPPKGLILSLEKIYDYARQNNFTFDSDFIRIHGWLVQFVEASLNPLWITAIENAKIKIVDNRGVSVIDTGNTWRQCGFSPGGGKTSEKSKCLMKPL